MTYRTHRKTEVTESLAVLVLSLLAILAIAGLFAFVYLNVAAVSGVLPGVEGYTP